jgi:DNA-binding NtrC family response regulator
VIRRLREDAQRLLATDRPVLLLGETGTGKGVLARWLHAHSPRAKEAFVDLNCAGLSRELLETELFGHEAGAFTGATRRKPGLLEEAHRGTVFLDEVAEMEATVQAKLLKALDERRIRRLGDTRDRVVDFRLIAATHRDLGALAREGRFREDLYFRLSTFPLQVPALRDRPDDLPEIAAVLLASFAAEIGRPGLRLGPGVIEALSVRGWRGNIRELRNVLERAALFAPGDVVPADLVKADEPSPSPGAGRDDGADDALTLEEVERRHVMRVLRAEKNRILPAARRLGIARSSLYERLRRYGVTLTEPGQSSGDET